MLKAVLAKTGLSSTKQGLNVGFLDNLGADEQIAVLACGVLSELAILGVIPYEKSILNDTGWHHFRHVLITRDVQVTEERCIAAMMAKFNHPGSKFSEGKPEIVIAAAKLAYEALKCGPLSLKDRRYDRNFCQTHS